MNGQELLIFMHMPKTAGTTVAARFRAALQPAEFLPLYGIRRTRNEIEQAIGEMEAERRQRIRVVCGHQVWYGIHELFDRPPRYVTVLREPASRVISHFWHLSRNPESVYFEGIRDGRITLDSWLAGESNPHTINQMTRYLARDQVGRDPADHEAETVTEATLSRAIERLSRFWFVGLTAALDLDLSRLLGRLGLEDAGQNERLGEPQSKRDRLDIDPALLGVSLRSNWADHRLFSYGTMLRERLLMDLDGHLPSA